MASLLIVDDERHITDRLAGFVPWDQCGVSAVYKAYSAEEALDVMESCSVDIVLTDIRMPGMSGLELSEQIRRRWRKTKCILLSGHAEFEYAKEAIRHGAVSYLLKPVKDEELLEAVGQVRKELEEEWRAIVSQERIAQTVRENLPQMRGNLLGELLLGKRYGASELRDKLAMLSVPGFYEQPFALMLVRLDQPFHTYDPQSLALVEYAVGNIAEELFLPDYELWHGKDVHGYLVFLIRDIFLDNPQSSSYRAALESKAGQLKEAIRSYLRGAVTILISRPGCFPDDLQYTYTRTLSALRRRIGDVPDLILTVADASTGEEESGTLSSLYELPSLVHLLEAGHWLQARDRLSRIAAELQTEGHLLEAYFAIASAASSYAHKNGKQLVDLIGPGHEKLALGMPFRNAQQLLDWSLELLDKLSSEVETDKRDSRSKLIADVQQFVEQHLDEDVSLTAIARHVYLHPVYISKIYKLETGENISDYVYRVRMEKAVRLLLDTTDKIYEIAACLGYQRAHSFIHVFKKHTGLTPQEYRDQYGL
ncbi:response regulator transcription factor [Paenibacillus senegalensis]|uniref:response regulator transcription factor n=1 Tax=Paenibacillus senegalensis TaxID=1465766 RepID=UPI00028961A6|nr:response regulator [Paenibacillus senegalensis]